MSLVFEFFLLEMKSLPLVSNHRLCGTQRLCGMGIRLLLEVRIVPGLPPVGPSKALTGWSCQTRQLDSRPGDYLVWREFMF